MLRSAESPRRALSIIANLGRALPARFPQLILPLLAEQAP